ncbi:tRNA dihydrouridine synthase DusB [Mesorhizobium sp. YIM 152430]|uniref:tRNA dihydrouridine synthase DusB n=1 Tax=Mesorhizobium sp. YIM 152430 TaxID=3031761 RepID=UPI0023DB42A0|nr:tRNA dihydrouridine synthase DusB [Mesorhizobium sp. YIM 152430]MDF1599967.1 tRNA dihydrouridine synthase DusB [Mesorhizobium sp. YIM 152430]
MTDFDLLARPLTIGTVTVPNRVFLAPLSGVTDEPMRRRALRHGAGMVVSEMVASGELARGRAESERRIRRPDVETHVVQLAGRDAHWMAEGARIATGEGADIIDINMGCPAKKVTGGYCGSALMREPDHALSLIEAVVDAVDVPVTVKMRLGWDSESLNAPAIAARAVAAGVCMITVHGRTREQFYKGKADWEAIRAVKDAISVPLVVNGDIADAATARCALMLSGADAVMVGRGHYGAPWAGARIVEASGGSPVHAIPGESELVDYVVAHYEDMLTLYGTGQGLRHARKHLGWYLDRHAPHTDPSMRTAIMTGLDPRAVISSLREAFAAPSLAAAA